MKDRANCCQNLDEVVSWFRKLALQGATYDDILDGLEFDSDQYPDMCVLKKAREIVFKP